MINALGPVKSYTGKEKTLRQGRPLKQDHLYCKAAIDVTLENLRFVNSQIKNKQHRGPMGKTYVNLVTCDNGKTQFLSTPSPLTQSASFKRLLEILTKKIRTIIKHQS